MPARKLEVAASTLTEACTRDLEAMLFMPNDATAGLYTHLAMSRFIDGDLAGAAAEIGPSRTPLCGNRFPERRFQPWPMRAKWSC